MEIENNRAQRLKINNMEYERQPFFKKGDRIEYDNGKVILSVWLVQVDEVNKKVCIVKNAFAVDNPKAQVWLDSHDRETGKSFLKLWKDPDYRHAKIGDEVRFYPHYTDEPLVPNPLMTGFVVGFDPPRRKILVSFKPHDHNNSVAVDPEHVFLKTDSEKIVKAEAVNHPSHYGKADDPYEVIKVIEAWALSFHTGNTVKYIARAGKKDPNKVIEDLEKARWYLDREIANLKAAKQLALDFEKSQPTKVIHKVPAEPREIEVSVKVGEPTDFDENCARAFSSLQPDGITKDRTLGHVQELEKAGFINEDIAAAIKEHEEKTEPVVFRGPGARDNILGPAEERVPRQEPPLIVWGKLKNFNELEEEDIFTMGESNILHMKHSATHAQFVDAQLGLERYEVNPFECVCPLDLPKYGTQVIDQRPTNLKLMEVKDLELGQFFYWLEEVDQDLCQVIPYKVEGDARYLDIVPNERFNVPLETKVLAVVS